MMETLPNTEVELTRQHHKGIQQIWLMLGRKMKDILINKWLLFYIVGFLLGRAIILSSISPFAIAYLATTWMVYRKRTPSVMFSIFVGALSYSVVQSIFLAISMIIFVLLSGLCKRIKHQQVIIPLFVFLSTASTHLFLYSIAGEVTSYEWLSLSVEGILGIILVLIFMQSMPILTPRKYQPTLKSEEIVCIIILLASILSGTIGWDVYGASFEQILSRYFVLLLAYVGGATVGATVGVVAGLILALAYAGDLFVMSLLAFSGLLGGLLKEWGKIGVSGGLLVGTALVSIYNDQLIILPSLLESLFAICLFILTPKILVKGLSRFIPGTEEYHDEQRQYLRRMRSVTAKRVEQFSNVFHALSGSFTTNEAEEKRGDVQQETDFILSQVTERTCQHCFMKEKCWEKQFDKTYSLMEGLKEDLQKGRKPNRKLQHQFENHCVKSKKVINVMEEELSLYEANQRLKKQVNDSKQFVADQLEGVSEVMDDFAREILEERKSHEKQEDKMVEAIQQLGIDLVKLDIFKLDKGDIDIEILARFYEYRGEGPKLIAPVLSEILGETVVVTGEDISPFPNSYCYFTFKSARKFTIETGVSSVAKGGGIVSGDSFKTIELGAGRYAMAISDGMGNGKRAHDESNETLRLLQQILQTGIQEKVAIKSINSILSLRSTDEMFATLDLAVVNLHNAFVRFLKIGSTPSYIKRGGDVHRIEAGNLPMGIIQNFDVDIVTEQLKAEDLLIMMSDGIVEGPKHVGNVEGWLKRKISGLHTDDPQEIADLLLEEVVRQESGNIADDMTVMVAKISRNTPEWSCFSTDYQAAE